MSSWKLIDNWAFWGQTFSSSGSSAHELAVRPDGDGDNRGCAAPLTAIGLIPAVSSCVTMLVPPALTGRLNPTLRFVHQEIRTSPEYLSPRTWARRIIALSSVSDGTWIDPSFTWQRPAPGRRA